MGLVLGHGFHPLKARRQRSISNLQSVPPLGAHSTSASTFDLFERTGSGGSARRVGAGGGCGDGASAGWVMIVDAALEDAGRRPDYGAVLPPHILCRRRPRGRRDGNARGLGEVLMPLQYLN